jgi:pyruvate dehydrogenase E2 component (dihydrolipoamide acetyltransferase)
MASEVTLPALGESVTEGTVTRWLKQVGDTIAVDEPLLEVSTDKVDTEIPSPVAGTLLEQKVDEDDTIEVGAVLAIVGEEGEDSGSGGGSDEAGTEERTADDGSGDEPGEDRSEDAGGKDAGRQAPTAEQSSGGGGGGGQSVTLPALGESVTEGTVTRWLKQVGDEVAVDEPLLEVSTDKVDTEIPSPVAGTLLEQKVDEDETVEVGAELAVIGSGDGGGSGQEEQAAEPQAAEPEPEPEPEPQAEEKQPEPEEKQPEPEPEPQAEEKQPEPQESSESSEGGHGYVTPLVRKLADQHGVDLAAVTGSGVGGRIRKQDVLAAAEEASKASKAPEPQPEAPAAAEAPAASAPSVSPSPLRGRTEKMSRLRKVIAARMVESLQTSAQLTTVVEVDVTPIARLRDRVKADFAAREGVKLSFMPFFAKASIDALKQHPSLNAAIDTEKGEVTYFDRENIAIAVDTEKGLLTPVVKDAGDLSIAGLARKIADVAERTRASKIGPDELSGGTFTLTNTGSRGALFDTPIINQPQVAILGTGSVVKRPVVIDDPNLGETIAVRHMVYLALTYDHRLVDGADAARFLSEVKERLESGQFEV